MYKEIKLEEITGKTIVGYVFSYDESQLLLKFNDNTFTIIGASRNYDYVEIRGSELDLFDFGDEELINIGIATKEEIDTIKEDIRMRNDIKREENLKKQYEVLKEKFESNQTQ